jgi:DNA-binding transcriptional MerR regulator
LAAVEKGPDAFRTISEASGELGVPQHVLRFWETRFSFIRPMKRAGGRRFYRPQDLEVLRGVRVLLQHEGYTIKGVQRLHREQGVKRLLAAARGEGAPPPLPEDVDDPDGQTVQPTSPTEGLEAVLVEIDAVKARLDAVLARGAAPARVAAD